MALAIFEQVWPTASGLLGTRAAADTIRLPGTRQYNFFRDDVIRVLDQNMVRPGEIDLDEAPDEPVESPVRKRSVKSRRG